MIRMDGLEGLEKKLESLTEVNRMEAALKNACAMVERTAKKKAPKDTGDLRRSITSEIEQDGEELVGTVFTPLEYAPYVEFGTGLFAEDGGRKDVPWNYKDDKGIWHSTSGQHPQPFLRPALEENREEILRMLKEALLDD